MISIAVICPYFGQLPRNIEITLKSMAQNKNITWFLVSDCASKYVGNYNNIHIVDSSFNEFVKLIKDKIGTDLFSPYKICDYKPAFGHIFDDLFAKYDFWGYYDLDVVYGKIEDFITEKILKQYDKIYDLGHFSIYRNTPEIRMSYQGSEAVFVPYKEILNAKCICVFDETYDDMHRGINGVLSHMGYKIYEVRNEYADLAVKWKNFQPNCKENEKRDYYFEYSNGRLYMMRKFDEDYKEEMIYVHLQQKKDIPVLTNSLEHFYITPRGYIDYGMNIKDKFYFFDQRLIWYLRFRIKRKVSKIKGLRNISIDIVYR